MTKLSIRTDERGGNYHYVSLWVDTPEGAEAIKQVMALAGVNVQRVGVRDGEAKLCFRVDEYKVNG